MEDELPEGLPCYKEALEDNSNAVQEVLFEASSPIVDALPRLRGRKRSSLRQRMDGEFLRPKPHHLGAKTADDKKSRKHPLIRSDEAPLLFCIWRLV